MSTAMSTTGISTTRGHRVRPRPVSLLALIITMVLAGLPAVVGTAAPAAAAPGAAWTAYVANYDDDTVTPINTDTNGAGTPIPVGDGPHAVAITPNGATAYVVNAESDSVTPISTATNTAGAPIPVGNEPLAIAITPDGSKAYVANHLDGTVTPINTITNTAGSAISCQPCAPTAVAISPDGLTAYFFSDLDSGVNPLDTTTDTMRPEIPGTQRVINAAISPDGSTLYAPAFTFGSVLRVDTLTQSQIAPIQGFGPGFQLPRGIAVSPDGASVYWTDSSSLGEHDALNPYEVPEITPIAAGQLHAIALTPDGTKGFITNSIDDTVTPFDTATKTLGTPIAVGNTPWALAITPDQAPVARLQVTRAPIGSPTTFDASGSTVAYGTIASYAWDFGDGTTDITTSPITTHTYTGGSYTASMMATSSGGTSVQEVFTGTTALQNGGQRSIATAVGSLAEVGGPAVYQMTPAAGGIDGGTTVSIIGAGFTGATNVSFGTTPAAFTVNGDNSITAISPPGGVGVIADVRVTNSVGVSGVSTGSRFRYFGTVPAQSAPCNPYCIMQYGTPGIDVATSSNPCNVCTITGGVEVLQVPPECPGGGAAQMVPAGWVQAQQNGSGTSLSAITAGISYQMTMGQFHEDGNLAAFTKVKVCYVNGIPTQVGGRMAKASAGVSALAAPKPRSLAMCSATKPKAPCVKTKSLVGGVAHITMLLPPSGATFQVVADPVKVTKLAPAYGVPGSEITVTGKNFETVDRALVGGVEAPITNRAEKTLVVTIPDGARTGVVTLLSLSGSATSKKALVIGPAIKAAPKTGKVGRPVKITGVNLTGATAVAFNGAAATIVSVTDTQIVATVPASATTGPITVTTPFGTATSPASFTPRP